MNTFSPIRRQGGISLLEVLISVVVLSIGLLGIAGLQTISLKSTNMAHERAMAVILTETLFEVMRVNEAAARAGAFAMDCHTPAPGTEQWFEDVKAATSPQTCATVAWNDGVYTVTIDWSNERMNTDSIIVMETRP
ncbi:type IV pilus modification protein PilV [Alishewanella sp. d11]|uniref:type IV pilus modification protein PilV n=1 Tax=Alishewanella sp. d11 TaxID=3414030 RepID=UPI003BF90553